MATKYMYTVYNSPIILLEAKREMEVERERMKEGIKYKCKSLQNFKWHKYMNQLNLICTDKIHRNREYMHIQKKKTFSHLPLLCRIITYCHNTMSMQIVVPYKGSCSKRCLLMLYVVLMLPWEVWWGKVFVVRMIRVEFECLKKAFSVCWINSP